MKRAHLRARSRQIQRSWTLPLLQAVASLGVLAVLHVVRWQMRALRRGLAAAPRAAAARPYPLKPFADGERDLVDECSWESFPASDPPAFNAR